MSGYRDDLAAARSLNEQLERDLAQARVDAAELRAAREKAEVLERENAELRHNRYNLPRRDMRRLLVGAALVVLAWFDVIASWAHPYGKPPAMGLEAGVVCGLGGLIGAALIGFFGQHRKLALGALAATGLLLVRKPFAAPVISDWMGERHAYSMNSETHYYFLVPGILALVLTALLALATRARKPAA
jgi:hypothetical protein